MINALLLILVIVIILVIIKAFIISCKLYTGSNESMYTKPQTDKQLAQIIKHADTTEYSNLCLLLQRFAKINCGKYYKSIVADLLKKYTNDSSLYKKFWKHKSLNMYKENVFILDDYIKTCKEYKDFDKKSVVLDIGCGSGLKIARIGYLLELPKANINAIDIEGWSVNFNRSNAISFVSMKIGDKLPYESNLFDLITIFMALHHIDNHNDMIKEISRCLKSDGICIIREHDVLNNIDSMLCDVEHLAYEYSNDDFKLNKFKKINYKSKQEWKELFKNNNLTSKHSAFKTNKLLISPTRIYHEIFQKSQL